MKPSTHHGLKKKKSKSTPCMLMKLKSYIKADSSIIWSRMCGGANQYIFMVEGGGEKLISRFLLASCFFKLKFEKEEKIALLWSFLDQLPYG